MKPEDHRLTAEERGYVLVPLSLPRSLWEADGGHWGHSGWIQRGNVTIAGAELKNMHVIGCHGFPDRPFPSVGSKTWRDLKDVVMILGFTEAEKDMDEWERRARNYAG